MTVTTKPSGHTGRRLALIALVILLCSTVFILWPRGPEPPAIQGAILPNPISMPPFQLTSHRGEIVTEHSLNGQWHLISYGFTHCPDICPTTLYELAEFQKQLNAGRKYNDLRILFYTIDPGRDTQETLAQYVPWFHESFIGLRTDDTTQAQRFEKSLGITARVQPADDPSNSPSNYQVAHGMRLYLLDAQGRYRASLTPTKDRDGSQYYQPQRVLQDYLALRRWAAVID